MCVSASAGRVRAGGLSKGPVKTTRGFAPSCGAALRSRGTLGDADKPVAGRVHALPLQDAVVPAAAEVGRRHADDLVAAAAVAAADVGRTHRGGVAVDAADVGRMQEPLLDGAVHVETAVAVDAAEVGRMHEVAPDAAVHIDAADAGRMQAVLADVRDDSDTPPPVAQPCACTMDVSLSDVREHDAVDEASRKADVRSAPELWLDVVPST